MRLIREAFVLTLYHYWEKELNALLRIGRGDHLKLMSAIKLNGQLQVDTAGLERLRLIANTIKHNDGHRLYASEPGMFGLEAKDLEPRDRRGWHNFLRLTDEDILKGIAAVRASGPGVGWERGGDEIEEM